MHKNIKDTALKNFQFKILHRIMPTNKLLYQMKIINYNCCSFCFMYTETLEHFFYECVTIRNIWLRIFDELKLGDRFNSLTFDLETVLFGYDNFNDNYISGINTFIILFKKYIFKCKDDKINISFESAKFYLKYQSRIQKSVFKNADLEWAFLDNWLM